MTATVLVIGGAVLDGKVATRAAPILHTSNPAVSSWTPGGVGRNIAESLARLGSRVELVAPVGADAAGELILQHATACGIGMAHMIPSPGPTGLYLAVLDSAGDLLIGCSDMSATDSLTVADLDHVPALMSECALIVIDANLPAAVLAWLLQEAASRQVRVMIEPVSVAKSQHVREAFAPQTPVFAITPNVDELAALVGRTVVDLPEALARACTALHDRGCAVVWVSRGTWGSLLSVWSADGGQVVHTLSAPRAQVIDVTGAGDSLTAGFVHLLVAGAEPLAAASFGHAVAALTVESAQTVNPHLTVDLTLSRLASAPPVVQDVPL